MTNMCGRTMEYYAPAWTANSHLPLSPAGLVLALVPSPGSGL